MNMNPPRYTDLDQAVASEVRAEMARQKITATDLASKIGMVRATLSDRINGHIAFSAGELVSVAGALGITASDLTGEAERQMQRRVPTSAVA